MKHPTLLTPTALFTCLIVFICGCMSSCQDDDEPAVLPELPSVESPSETISEEITYASTFAQTLLKTFYVWNEEIAGSLTRLDPDTCTNPVQVVREIRYKNATTGVEDKWTLLTNDLNSLKESTQGISTTYGFRYKTGELKQGSTAEYYMVIALVHDDSPAAQAGLKRGDIIARINGKAVSNETIQELSANPSAEISTGSLKDGQLTLDGQTHQLTAVKMYENPILHHQIYDINGKKVGYLCYSAFDLESASKLIDICQKFKAAGVKELILDLRYNGGGYVVTEVLLASMLAPAAVAHNPQAVFEKESWNKEMMAYFQQKNISTETYFQTSWNYTEDKNGIDFCYDTKDANIGLEKIYGLITANTASASEAILGGLMPYMEVETIGTNSYGKYCTGQLLAPENIFSKYPDVIKEWGMYVMISIYQNANGETPCMPNGIKPDKEVAEGIDLVPWGDERDPLLRAALESAGKVYDDDAARAATRSVTGGRQVQDIPHNATFGKRIALPFRN